MHSFCSHYLFTLFLLLLPSSISAQSSCIPLNCVAQCQPNCSGADVCVLSTMSNCGQCPASKCMSPSLLGISSPSNTNSAQPTLTNDEQQGNNDSLIGGLVGGLVGGGLLIGGCAWWICKCKRSTSLTLPFQQPPSDRPPQQIDTMDTPSLSDLPRSLFDNRDSTCHSITSGVIPVTYIPPSNEMQESIHYINSTTAENPFQDPQHSPTNHDDDDMSHQSILSTEQHASHYQVTRAKPQILRVSSLRRNGSAPTLSTRPEKDGLARSNTIDLATVMDPFQTHRAQQDDEDDLGSRPSTNHSLGSTVGDGEITIFWHNN